ncbi:MAG TPA: GH92 family glycosyl hydrolase, partial [Opitutaceae bacterium]|nr:GH92 family glycosyl hydrolase [Opitutaceae bacterium]
MITQFRLRTFALLILTLTIACAGEPVDYVDTMIGTGNGGNTFPGPCLPNGFVKLSPDTDMKRAGGYDPRGKIRHFSHNHVSGMGGPKYGNVGLMPVTGPVDTTRLGHLSAKTNEVGKAGYYRVSLVDYHITAELTAAMHVGMHRYTFPESNDAHILVDVGASLQGTGSGWDSSVPTGGHVSIDPDSKEVSGYNSFVGGRASGSWKIYFVAKFDTTFESYGTWLDAGLTLGQKTKDGAFIGACLNFKTKRDQAIISKVGLSFVSVEQARKNLEKETPDWDFDQIAANARTAWAAELGKIQVEGPNETDKKIFYTGLYHMMLMPTDFTGENPFFNYSRPYYDDFLCIWDIFRVNFPLHFLINAPKATDMLNSLVDVYRHDGWLPDSRSAISYDGLQNGTNADILFAEAFAKGIKGVDYETALQGMIKNGETPSDNPRHYGRAALSDYLARGYVPVGTSNCVSRTVEYVYDDYCTYQLSQALGNKSNAERLKPHLLWYKNTWDASIGFMRGKNPDNTWITPFDPAKEQGSYDVVFYEGNAYQWSYYAPHDGKGLVNLYGG